jgi:hypothetical protein
MRDVTPLSLSQRLHSQPERESLMGLKCTEQGTEGAT